MQNLQVLLVEDDRSAALDVEMLLDEMGLKLAAVMDNAEAALKYIYEEQPDLVIMDVELKGDMSGIDVANEIKHLRIPIIFTTSYKDKRSFDAAKSVYSFGYLVKPFDKLSLRSILEQVEKTLFPQISVDLEAPTVGVPTEVPLQDTLLVKHINMLYPIKYSDILFIQGEGNYCTIHTENRKFMLKASLKKMLETVPSHEFSAVHKSFIVRLDKVESIDIGSGKLSVGKEILPLGRIFKNAFLDRFTLMK